MTLIDYFNQFWDVDEEKHLTQAETRLYFYLLHLWNSTGRTEWFEGKTSMIERYADINPMTLKRCRDSLKKKGLLDFKQGSTKGKHPHYLLINVKDDVKENVKENVKDYVTDNVKDSVTETKEKVSPTPPLKENNLELREKERITKVIPKKEFDLSFVEPSFLQVMQEWLDFKRSKGKTYKSDASVRKCYNNLLKLSNNNPTTAQLIVDRSIANNWDGLFELKNHGESTHTSSGAVHSQPRPIQDHFSNYLRENFGFNGTAEEFEEWFNQNPYGG